MYILSFLVFVFVTSFTPGPNTITAMALATNYGLKKTARFSLGVGLGFFLLTLLSSFFNRTLIKYLPIVEMPLAILGVGYMLYLAYKILTSKASNEKMKKTKSFFTIGILLQFVNPKGILFSITVVTTFILPYYETAINYLLFSMFLGFVGLVSTFTWSLFGTILQKYLVQYRKPFNIIMSLLLVYSALSIVLA
ncbi:LysE family translocator [Alkalicoccobacillus murimartini]|uniref:Threonine/homoserine/homoserine lactone efflux protein n=1 Tax=Alkalicoccobacillus murimartini TaxID=171685 RepID=A0ABT9YCY6_9BACI|nr:LysE family transporter [Alkalicoccobacillus murimartini]MDQ0205714.1 threonine/homoserine/homoserine lactone efflux protein [Alkalicoccobacillus murimartini]